MGLQVLIVGGLCSSLRASSLLIEEITINCQACGSSYQTQFRASMNLGLDDFDDDYIEDVSTGTCPECSHKVSLGCLVVRADGVWEIDADEEDD